MGAAGGLKKPSPDPGHAHRQRAGALRSRQATSANQAPQDAYIPAGRKFLRARAEGPGPLLSTRDDLSPNQPAGLPELAMSQPSVRDEIEVVETKINAGLKQDPSGQSWQLQLDGAQWGIVLEALQRYKAQADGAGTHPGLS